MKKALLFLMMMMVCSSAFAQIAEKEKTADYWVYVRLEDRSGVTTADDAGRSKAGDVVAVLPVTPQYVPSETEKKEWMIYKASLTESQVSEMLTPWVETKTKTESIIIPKEVYEDTAQKEAYLKSIRAVSISSATAGTKSYSVSAVVEYEKSIAYRKNKLDTSALGVKVEKGLVPTKIDASKISVDVKTTADLSRYETKRKVYAYFKRPFLKLTRAFIKPAFAETVSTTNKTGEDYNTITLWEDATDIDLVSATKGETLEVYNDEGALNEKITFAGATTNSSYYRKVTVPSAERHGASFGGGARNIYTTELSNEYIVEVDEAYFILEWLEISGGSLGDYTTNGYVYINGRYSTIRYTLIGNITSSWHMNGIICNNYESDKNILIYRNIIAKIAANNTTAIDTGFDGANTASNVANYNTIYDVDNSSGTDRGVNCASDSSTCIGNLVFDAGTDFIFDSSSTHDYNAASDSTTSEETNGVGSIDADDFVSSTDFHLAIGATPIDKGSDLGSPYNYDIDGVQITGTWDIGADEYVAAGGATYYPFKQFNHGINVGVF